MTDASSSETQLVVIGGGPGGYAAAFGAADGGMKVTLVDADTKPGGVCLLRGCIPSKALLHVAKLMRETQDAKRWGLDFAAPKIDLDTLRSWKESVVDKLSGGVQQLCKRRKVEFLQAWAKFRDSRTLQLRAACDHNSPPPLLRFEHAILATGSSSAVPPIFRIDDPRVMDSTAALELADIPEKLLVVGGGYIGLELGTVYAALGSAVTVVEMTNGLLPGVDRDLVRPLRKRLDDLFEAIHLETKVVGVQPEGTGIVATLQGKGTPRAQKFDRVLIAVGRQPNSQGLGLEHTAVQLDENGFVRVDRQQRTPDPRILAIGDVTGEPMLAHKATREAKVAVENLLGKPTQFDNVAIPAVVFTDPEIAWCGLTENQAKAEGREVSVVRYPWGASGRAQTLDRPEGQTKLLFDPATGKILGVGIVGAGAGELIAEGVLAIESGTVAQDLAKCIHPHPTLSETIAEAAEAFLGQATHLYRPKG